MQMTLRYLAYCPALAWFTSDLSLRGWPYLDMLLLPAFAWTSCAWLSLALWFAFIGMTVAILVRFECDKSHTAYRQVTLPISMSMNYAHYVPSLIP